MRKEEVKNVIEYIKQNPGVFYDNILTRFSGIKKEGLFMMLYGLCEPKRSKKGELLNILYFEEEIWTRHVGIGNEEGTGGRRAIEMGRFRLAKESYSEERLDEIFKYWQLESI